MEPQIAMQNLRNGCLGSQRLRDLCCGTRLLYNKDVVSEELRETDITQKSKDCE